MMTQPVHVILSQGPTLHPQRRALEQQLVAELTNRGSVEILVVPHLYDLPADGPSIAALRRLTGPLIVLAWQYPRAIHWTLDQYGVRGRPGKTGLDPEDSANPAEAGPVDESADESADEPADEQPGSITATSAQTPRDAAVPSRPIYSLDLRQHETAHPYLEAIDRIIAMTNLAARLDAAHERFVPPDVRHVDEATKRRWYPVIDFSRCTHCLECIDFCLFGVYGIDESDRVLVELPDLCRKGCPACARVCPEQAIVFPQHKSSAIAGGAFEPGGLKMDLSSLFGAADDLLDAHQVAARERDEHLLLTGQRPAGASLAADQPASDVEPATTRRPVRTDVSDASDTVDVDPLDALIDRLDALDV